MNGLLKILDGEDAGKTVPVEEGGEIVIGRLPECDVRLLGEKVSRQHTRVWQHEGSWLVADLGSRNGTYVNDVRTGGEWTLNDGDRIRIGSVTILFTVPGPQSADAEEDGDLYGLVGDDKEAKRVRAPEAVVEEGPVTRPAEPAASETPAEQPREVVRVIMPVPHKAMSWLLALALVAVGFVIGLLVRQARETPVPEKPTASEAALPARPAPEPTQKEIPRPKAKPAPRPKAARDDSSARRRARVLAKAGSREYDAQKYASAIMLYSEAASLSPDDDARFLFVRGLARTSTERPEEAIADFNGALRSGPVCREALHAARATAYLEHGEYAKALADCNEALRIDPEFQDVHYLRGFVHFAQGEMQEAKKDFDQALSLNPRDAEALRARARVHEALGQRAEAHRDIEKAEAIEEE